MLINILVRSEDSVPELTNLKNRNALLHIPTDYACVCVCTPLALGSGVVRNRKCNALFSPATVTQICVVYRTTEEL